ncbi:ArsR/SmtB family transcription factor [Chloroflexota bacterium]
MDEVEKLAEIFKALSDPTRLRLVKLLNECSSEERSPGDCVPEEGNGGSLCNGGPLCVNALAHNLGVTQSAVSQHLRVLRQAELVRGERRGSFVHYSLDQDGLNKYKAALLDTLGEDFVTR